MDRKEIGKFIKQARKKRQLSQSQLNKLLGYAENSIFLSRIERGVASFPEKKIPQLAEALKITEQTLVKIFHPDMPGICYTLGEASSPVNLVSPTRIKKNIDLAENKSILDAIVFLVKSDFLEPIAKKNQRVLVSYSSPINPGDYILLVVFPESAEKVIPFMKKIGKDSLISITTQTGENHIIGQLKSITKNEIVIQDIKNPSAILSLNPGKDVNFTARIAGVLF